MNRYIVIEAVLTSGLEQRAVPVARPNTCHDLNMLNEVPRRAYHCRMNYRILADTGLGRIWCILFSCSGFPKREYGQVNRREVHLDVEPCKSCAAPTCKYRGHCSRLYLKFPREKDEVRIRGIDQKQRILDIIKDLGTSKY